MPAPARAFPLRATLERFGPANDVDGSREFLGAETVKCNLQPQWSREDTVSQDQLQDSWNLYLPPGTVVGHQDRLVIGDLEVEALGAGRPYSDFAGRPHHVEAVVRRTL